MKTIISFFAAVACSLSFGFAQNRCILEPTDCTNEHITYFSLNGAENTSACSQIGYFDRPGVFTELVKGFRYVFQANTSSDQTHLAIWIDFNRNGDFTERDEMVFSSQSMSGSFSGVIVVPRVLAVANYTLRVKVSRNIQMFSSDACVNFDQGEVEDYTVAIVDLNMSKPTLLTGNVICAESQIRGIVQMLNHGQGVLPQSNVFQIQMAALSDNFSNWATVATLNSTTIDTFSLFIPHTFNDDIYKLRVVSNWSETLALVSDEIKISRNFAPPVITTPNLNVCTPSNRLLSFSSSGTVYSWYTSSDTLNPLLHKAASLMVNNINKDTTFFVAVRNTVNGCESRKTKATFRFVNTQVSDFNPKTGIRGLTQLLITGINLQHVSHLTIGSVNTTNFTINNTRDTLKVTIPATAASGNVIVHTPCSSTTLGHLTVNIARVEPVIISPEATTFEGEALISMSSATPGATIYFTTNGSNPVIGASFTRVYTGPFIQRQTVTIRAMAAIPGMINSVISVKSFTINNPSFVEPVSISPAPGTYQSAKTITLSTLTPGATIYYTLNGTVPLIGSSATMEYLHPFTISDARTNVRAIAIKNNVSSTHTSAVYFITRSDTLKRPTMELNIDNTNLLSQSMEISLSTSTPDASIYYTTNGSRVLIGSEHTYLYQNPIEVTEAFMLTARAFKHDFVPSPNLRRYISMSLNAPFRFAAFVPDELRKECPELLVYPNPTHDVVHIENIDTENAQIRLITAGGKIIDGRQIVQSSFDNRCTLTLHHLPKGLYILQIATSLGSFERKVVLN